MRPNKSTLYFIVVFTSFALLLVGVWWGTGGYARSSFARHRAYKAGWVMVPDSSGGTSIGYTFFARRTNTDPGGQYDLKLVYYRDAALNQHDLVRGVKLIDTGRADGPEVMLDAENAPHPEYGIRFQGIDRNARRLLAIDGSGNKLRRIIIESCKDPWDHQDPSSHAHKN